MKFITNPNVFVSDFEYDEDGSGVARTQQPSSDVRSREDTAFNVLVNKIRSHVVEVGYAFY